jgi:hypothetical protein
MRKKKQKNEKNKERTKNMSIRKRGEKKNI